jgi:hypothetical protein
MKVSYRMSLTERKAASKLLRRRNIVLRYDVYFWSGLSALCVLLGVALPPGSTITKVAAGLLIPSLVFALGLPVLRAIQDRQFVRTGKRNQSAEAQSSTEINSERVVDVTPGAYELAYEWSAITGFAQNDKITLFVANDSHVLYFPTSALSALQLTELREMIAQRGIKKWS